MTCNPPSPVVSCSSSVPSLFFHAPRSCAHATPGTSTAARRTLVFRLRPGEDDVPAGEGVDEEDALALGGATGGVGVLTDEAEVRARPQELGALIDGQDQAAGHHGAVVVGCVMVLG